MFIHGKTFTVACLYTYIAKNIRGRVNNRKNCERSPLEEFALYGTHH